MATGAAGAAAAASAVGDPLKLFTDDAAVLIPSFTAKETTPAADSTRGGLVSYFYQSSVLTGLLVGASFVLSPVSPIALFEAEGPATHFLREVRLCEGRALELHFMFGPIA